LIGQRILIALNAAGKNQADLARGLKISPTTVKGWVKDGRIPLADMILPICDFLNVSPTWLLSNDDTEIMPKSTKDELSKSEKSLVSAYNLKPEMKELIDKLLGLDDEYVYVFQASDSYEDHKSGMVKMTRSELKELEAKLAKAKPIKKI